MTKLLRLTILLAAGLILSACAAPHVSLARFTTPPRLFAAGPHDATKPAKLKPSAKLKAGEWAQAHSDIAPDPNIIFGALPNGMRYAIGRQQTPPGQAALRLRIDAGSLMETDAQSGLAHFLEHMAFNGSKQVPEGEMIKTLERRGLAFGADTNASTDFEQTLYKLDLPHTDDDTVDTALMLLRETASELTIAPAAVDRERGVVLSEERLRDSPAYRVYVAGLAFFMQDQLPPKRLPIGKVEVLKTAPASRIAEFYHSYYRPDRAVLVAVGDFDPAAMEAKIKARFGDWKPQGAPGPDPVRGPVQPRRPEARLLIEPGARLSGQIAWIRPPESHADSQVERKSETLERLGFAVLNRRLSRLARSEHPAFLGAGGFRAKEYHAADVTQLAFSAQTTGWQDALAAVDQEQRRLIQFGVRQDELDREIEETRAGLKAEADAAATRTPSDIAADIVGSLDEDDVVTSPAQDLTAFDADVKGLKAESVSAVMRARFQGASPLIYMTSPKPIAGGQDAVLAAYQASTQVPVTAPSAQAALSWPYPTFGTPGQIVETREVADLDTVFYRFANGVRLTVKPTKFKADEVMIRVNIGAGRTGLSKTRTSPAWATGAFIEGGLAKITAEDMEQVLAKRLYGARLAVADDALVLSGETRPADLDVELQVLAAYVADPGWRPEAFQRLKASVKTLHDQYEATDGGVMARDVQGLIHNGDPRWAFPTRQELAEVTLPDLKSLITPDLATGALDIVIIGDISPEKAADLVAQTFAALPPRSPTPAPSAAQREVKFPAPTAAPLTRTHKGRADQATAYLAWPTPDFYANPQAARDDAVMAAVLQLRLIDELREKQGATYSPQVASNHSLVWPGWGVLAVTLEVPPAKLAGVAADIQRIAADLRDHPPTADELTRAKKPRLDNLIKARETNAYWLSELSGADADPRRLDNIRAILPGTERVTAQDVQAAARRILRPETLWRLEVRPEGQ